MEVNESGQKKFLGKNISAGSKYFKKLNKRKKLSKKTAKKSFSASKNFGAKKFRFSGQTFLF